MADDRNNDNDDSDDARPTLDERRRTRRARLILDLFFNGTDLTGVASIDDISLGGLYMKTQHFIPENSLLTLRIPFAEGDVIVNGEVAYTRPKDGVGIRFQGLNDVDREVIKRALAGK